MPSELDSDSKSGAEKWNAAGLEKIGTMGRKGNPRRKHHTAASSCAKACAFSER